MSNLRIPTRIALICSAFALFAGDQAFAAGWKLVFQDEFQGNALDRSRWATRYVYRDGRLDHLNDELQHYRDNDNHRVRSGELQLVARRTGENAFESGMIRSLQTFYYGYFEARVWLPRGKGIWPAFWLNSDYDATGKLSWPPEIDIFEYVVNGKDDTESMLHSAAADTPRGSPVDYTYTDPRYSKRWKSYVAEAPLNRGWHVFGLVWRPNDITMLIDGKPIYRRPYSWRNREGRLAAPAHVLLNFAVGGKWPGRYGIDYDAFPQALRIDYVRVCQFSRAADAGSKCGGSPFTPSPGMYAYDAPYGDLPRYSFGTTRIVGAAAAKAFRPGDRLDIESRFKAPNGALADRLVVTLRPKNGGKAAARSVTDLSSQTSTGVQTRKTAISIPATIAPGHYDIVQEVFGVGDAKDKAGRRLTVMCGASSSRSLSCNTASVTIAKAS